jgi:3-oxoadipate enol-lactonase
METIKKIQVKSGSTLSYVEVGQGTPVILIHGLFLDRTAFAQQIKAFADQARIVAIDIHGHGESSVLNQPMSLDEMAEDYLDLVQQIRIQQAIWGGVSLGGMTSLRIAIQHPEAVLGLLLLNTNAGSGAGKKVPSFDGLNAPLTLRFLWNTRFLKSQVLKAGLFGRTTLETNPDLQEHWVDRMEQIKSISMKHSIEAVLSARSILDQLSSSMYQPLWQAVAKILHCLCLQVKKSAKESAIQLWLKLRGAVTVHLSNSLKESTNSWRN